MPLKNSVTVGIIWSLEPSTSNFKHSLKNILNYYPLVLPEHFVSFLKKFAEYTLTPLGVLIKHVLPKELTSPAIVPAEYIFKTPNLTPEQSTAKNEIVNKT